MVNLPRNRRVNGPKRPGAGQRKKGPPRRRIEVPTSLGTELLDLCKGVAKNFTRPSAMRSEVDEVYATKRFEQVERGTVETLVCGLMVVSVVRNWSGLEEKRTEYQRKKRHSPSMFRSAISEPAKRQRYREQLFHHMGWITDDYLDRLVTMLFIGFMHEVGDQRITKATWYPLGKILVRYLLTPEMERDIRQKFEAESLPEDGLQEERVKRLKNNIRSRVSYLANEFFHGTIPTLAPTKLFREVQTTIHAAMLR